MNLSSFWKRNKPLNIKVILRSGNEILIKCESCEINRSTDTTKCKGYKFEGITGTKPVFIDVNEIVAVIRME